MFITAVEALVPDDRGLREDEVVRLLDLLVIRQTTPKVLPEGYEPELLGILRFSREETITEVGKDLAGQLTDKYDGRRPRAFFDRCYSGRSALLHGSTDPDKRPTPAEVQRTIPHLQRFVLDLLAAESARVQTGDDSASA